MAKVSEMYDVTWEGNVPTTVERPGRDGGGREGPAATEPADAVAGGTGVLLGWLLPWQATPVASACFSLRNGDVGLRVFSIRSLTQSPYCDLRGGGGDDDDRKQFRDR